MAHCVARRAEPVMMGVQYASLVRISVGTRHSVRRSIGKLSQTSLVKVWRRSSIYGVKGRGGV